MFEIVKIFEKNTNTVKVSENAIRTSIPSSIKDFLELDAEHQIKWIACVDNNEKFVKIQKTNVKNTTKK